MIQELDSVVLTVDLPQHGLRRGDVGTVVLVHAVKELPLVTLSPDAIGTQGLPQTGLRESLGYEVEFMALDGETLAVASLTPAQVRPIAPREIAHARPV